MTRLRFWVLGDWLADTFFVNVLKKISVITLVRTR